ncbi:amidohydrolase family protein [Actinomadura kijaniata]|uniref:L-fuconolactonase n=1 Tax=Actinomadura namibiensis TaxID=182080 RepID=A0A7W3QRW4_ACTNM|nr:amidohydrolase family protein [Actinomadura namibiensis]MBA8957194.1 L-fuconolactonase [Actinomadura namibiensis]
MLDAHHHLWDTSRRSYPWMDGPWADPLRGRFDADRYARVSGACGVTASIAVQALHDVAETRELLDVARGPGPVAGVVGWCDLTAPDVADTLAGLAAGPLVGIRHLVQDEPDPDWLGRPDVRRGLRAVGAAGLVYDLLVRPPQAGAALAAARALPEVSLVLDHAGKPDIAGGGREPWASWLRRMAALPNVTVKLSGLVTEAAPGGDPADIMIYARHVLETFGPDRVMYGSDWPVCTLAASYREVADLAGEAMAGLTDDERAAVAEGTARRVYGLES